MKKYSICLGISLVHYVFLTASFAQSLTMHKTFGGARFEYSKDTSTFSVSPKQVLDIMGDDPLAYQEFKKQGPTIVRQGYWVLQELR